MKHIAVSSRFLFSDEHMQFTDEMSDNVFTDEKPSDVAVPYQDHVPPESPAVVEELPEIECTPSASVSNTHNISFYLSHIVR
jgi:hypothetical protein